MPPYESSESAASSSGALAHDVRLPGVSAHSELDLAGVTALFAAHGGSDLPAQVSADLALEIVLNEIVEQACLATGASGAAIGLMREGEIICRASSGSNAPELGARLGSESGLTAECVTTRQVQRCADAQSDPRADIEASRRLGVRAVMILPLLRDGDLLGVLEVFSSRPGVFSERDELTLEALARRILKNLDQAREPSRAAAENPTLAPVLPIATAGAKNATADFPANGEEANVKADVGAMLEDYGRSRPARRSVVTVFLGAAIVVCAVLLGTLVGVGLGWRRTIAVRGPLAKPGSSAAPNAQEAARPGGAQAGGAKTNGDVKPAANAVSVSPTTGKSTVPVPEKNNASPAPGSDTSRSGDAAIPAGSLRVYENGKEVFRMQPAGKARARSEKATSAGDGMQPASSLQPAEIVDLPPEKAQGNLLRRVEPEYPEEARQQGIQGPVVLDVRIGRDGVIQEVKLVSGQSLLAEAAMAAVKQWRFKPHTRQGRAVEMQTKVTLNFRLPD